MGSLPCFDYGTQGFDSDFEVVLSNTLQCTSFASGSNKFYQMELHHGKTSGKWRVFTANGRTGVYSKPRERVSDDEATARDEYQKILREKTTRKKEPYTIVDVVATKMGTDAGNQRIISSDFKKDKVQDAAGAAVSTGPKIAGTVRILINRLFEEAGQTCRSQLHGSLQTSAENPLGTLSLTQIEQGKAILKEANEVLSKQPSLVNTIESEVIRVTNAFYSAIPHNIPWRPREEAERREWMKRFALNNSTILDEKYDLLDLLADVKGMMAGFATSDEHSRLREANCEFEEVDLPEFKRIGDFVTNTSSVHHSWTLYPKHIWKVLSKSQVGHRSTIDRVGNIKALFHGSRSGNILGICKKGLLLRPPGAYVTGSLLGNGLYFADQSTKSSQYSTARFGGTSSSHGDTYFMFVADVALGKIKEMTNGDQSMSRAPHGFNSVMGKKGYTSAWNGTLLHNEFVIFDIPQHQLTHLIEFSQRF